MEFELFERLYNNCKIVKMLLKHDVIFGSYVHVGYSIIIIV